jgi:predicted short-subunit dehydrogenase-like oxidoreductase (DUF2520 family)
MHFVLKLNGGQHGVGALSGPVGRGDWECCADSPFKGQGVHSLKGPSAQTLLVQCSLRLLLPFSPYGNMPST